MQKTEHGNVSQDGYFSCQKNFLSLIFLTLLKRLIFLLFYCDHFACFLIIHYRLKSSENLSITLCRSREAAVNADRKFL
jgi:hypothetical protein